MAFMKRARDKGKAQALRLLDEIAAADEGQDAASEDNGAHATGRRSFNILAPGHKHKQLNNSEDRTGFHDDDDDDEGAGDIAEEQKDSDRKRAKGTHASAGASSSAAHVTLQGGKGMQTLHASFGGATSLTSSGAVTVANASTNVAVGSSRSSRATTRAAIFSKPDSVMDNSALPQNASGSANSATSAGNTKRGRQPQKDKNSESNAASVDEQYTPDNITNPWLAPPTAAVSIRDRSSGNQHVSSSATLQPMPASDFIREQSNEAATADIQEAFA
jgi:hypothetical protein